MLKDFCELNLKRGTIIFSSGAGSEMIWRKKMKKYFHIDNKGIEAQGNYEHQGFWLSMDNAPIHGGYAFVRKTYNEHIVSHEGNDVLVVQVVQEKDGRLSRYVNVPGIVVDWQYEFTGDNEDVPITKVKPITEKDGKDDLTKILVESFDGPINFW